MDSKKIWLVYETGQQMDMEPELWIIKPFPSSE